MFIEDTAQVCKIHNSDLVEGRVPVLYGLIRYSDQYLEARKIQFPNSKFLVLGGCVVGNIFFHNIRYCPHYRESHIAWAMEHESKEGLAPTEVEHEKYIEYLAEKSGIPRNIPESVHRFIESGETAKVIKALKESNPNCSFAALKLFAETLKQRKGE
jgi:hypothetical protein